PPGQSHLIDPVLYVPGSYAALAYSSSPPYASPASVEQQLAYYVYAFSTNHMTLHGAGRFVYNDTGYAVLGAVASAISERFNKLTSTQFMNTQFTKPLGISPPLENPPCDTPMAAIARTRRLGRYPTEVAYFANASEPAARSIFPKPHATQPPFDPPRRVPQPY